MKLLEELLKSPVASKTSWLNWSLLKEAVKENQFAILVWIHVEDVVKPLKHFRTRNWTFSISIKGTSCFLNVGAVKAFKNSDENW